jgi:hypothetical protein
MGLIEYLHPTHRKSAMDGAPERLCLMSFVFLRLCTDVESDRL